MQPRSTFLLRAALGALFLIITGERTLSAYAYRHFGPAQKLEHAEQRGAGCIVVTGDSRMAAGFHAESLIAALRSRDRQTCVVDLSVGALGLAGQVSLLRQYLADGFRPPTIVVGSVPEEFLAKEARDPASWTGNEAALLLWSRVGDAALHFPDSEGSTVERWDRRLRFQIYRSNAFGIYRSLLWSRVQAAQDKLIGVERGPANQFGSLADMSALAATFRNNALEAYRQKLDGRPWHFSLWLAELQELASGSGSRLVLAELPMPSAFREEVRVNATARDLRRALALAAPAAVLLDLSLPPWLSEARFSDGLHLDDDGARLISADLGRMLAEMPWP